MSSYIEDTLTKGETVLLSGKIALRKYWLNFLLAGLFILTGISVLFMVAPTKNGMAGSMVVTYLVLAALFLFVPIMRYFTNELALTNKRVIAKFGIISLDAVEIRLEKIESIIVKQGIFGRILGYGTVIVIGTGATHAVIPSIVQPVLFKRQFNSALESLAATAV